LASLKVDEAIIRQLLASVRGDVEGQDIAEYAIMLAVVLVIILGMVRMIGSSASIIFSQVGSTIQ
jgi:Flp pilus assembly pilin Flp